MSPFHSKDKTAVMNLQCVLNSLTSLLFQTTTEQILPTGRSTNVLELLQKLVPQLQRYRYKQYQRQPLQPSLCQQHALHLTYGPTLVQSSRRLFSISDFCFAFAPYSPKHNTDFSPYMTKQNIFSLICQNKTVRLSGVLAGFDLSFVFLSFWSCPSCLCSHKTIKHLVAIQYIYCQFLFCIQFCNYNSLHLLLGSLIDWLAVKFLSSVVCFPVWRTLFTFRSLFALPLSVNLTAIQSRPPAHPPTTPPMLRINSANN